MDGFLYEQLNNAWKRTCKIIFGEEVGELKEFEEWLSESFSILPLAGGKAFVKHTTSSLSGKRMAVFAPFYGKNAKFATYKELMAKSIEPLSINQIKDIDSIIEAWKERWYYVGEVILGNSKFVELSDSVFSSYFVYNSYAVEHSNRIVSSVWVRDKSSYLFGGGGGPNFEFSIRVFYGGWIKRSLEVYTFTTASDIYYSHVVDSSKEIMFSFMVKGINTFSKASRFLAISYSL